MIKLHIVIPSTSYTNSSNLLNQIKTQNDSQFKIFITIVLQGHTTFKIKEQEFIVFREYLGSSVARNVGACYNKECDYILFLDEDISIESEFLNNLYELLIKYENIDFLAGNLFISNSIPYNKHSTCEVYENIDYNFSKIHGALMLIKNNIFFEVNGFDENFGINCLFGGMEETSLVLKLLDKGYHTYREPTFYAYHPEYIEEYSVINGYKKAFINNVGFGAMFKKIIFKHRNYKVLKYFLLSYIKSIIAIPYYLLKLNLRMSGHHIIANIARLYGFIKYRSKFDKYKKICK